MRDCYKKKFVAKPKASPVASASPPLTPQNLPPRTHTFIEESPASAEQQERRRAAAELRRQQQQHQDSRRSETQRSEPSRTQFEPRAGSPLRRRNSPLGNGAIISGGISRAKD